MATENFLDFVRVVVAGDVDRVSQRLADDPAVAQSSLPVGATRQNAETFFFTEIRHYIYAGDTALHMAAAAFRRPIAELLVSCGADCGALNRRRAQPLHYAADAHHWNPAAQADTIQYLTSIGADPCACDVDGTAPLHRAVRTRSLAAVKALLDAGADPRQRNKSGSMPLHLAVQPTGRGGSGSPEAREQQAGIVQLLLERGARLRDRDGRGRVARAAAASEWIRSMLKHSVA